jgi:hypothetical protein
MFRATIPLIAFTLALAACSPESAKEPIVRTEQAISKYDPARDYFTFANTDQFVTKHLELDLTVDFDAQQLHGSATDDQPATESTVCFFIRRQNTLPNQSQLYRAAMVTARTYRWG